MIRPSPRSTFTAIGISVALGLGLEGLAYTKYPPRESIHNSAATRTIQSIYVRLAKVLEAKPKEVSLITEEDFTAQVPVLKNALESKIAPWELFQKNGMSHLLYRNKKDSRVTSVSLASEVDRVEDIPFNMVVESYAPLSEEGEPSHLARVDMVIIHARNVEDLCSQVVELIAIPSEDLAESEE